LIKGTKSLAPIVAVTPQWGGRAGGFGFGKALVRGV